MKSRILPRVMMATLLAGFAAANAADPYSPDTSNTPRENAHEVKEDVKEAGRDTKAAAKGAARDTGEFMSDSAITTKVKASLLTEKNLKSLGIHVDTKDGVVTLSGTVPSSAEIKQAEEVTRDVKGVKDVRNSLKLKAG